MGYKQAEQLGLGEGSLRTAILREDIADAVWSASPGLSDILKYNSVSYDFINSLVKKPGTEIAVLIKNMAAETFYTFANLRDGEFLVRHNGLESRWSRVYPYYYYKTATGSILPFNIGSYPAYYSTGSYVTYNYFSVLFDDETKRMLFILLRTEADGSICDVRVSRVINDEICEINVGKSLYELFRNSITVYEPDPWGDSFADIGGGNATLDLSSDTVNLPEPPQSIVSTGFIQLYTPSFKQINELSDYMWGDNFLSNVLKLWNDPMDIIINLAQFRLVIPTVGSQYVRAGNVVTTVEMNYPSNQYITVDCGALEVTPFYNAYIDYEPYTTCEIFLPYIGFQTLSMDEIMGKLVQVTYRIDLVTGICCAYVLCDGTIMYTFTGTCSANIPISSQNFQSMAQSIMQLACTGAAAAVKEKGNAGASMLSSGAQTVTSFKPGVSRSGSISTNAGFMGPQRPYLVFTVPNVCLPKDQNKFIGYPAYVTFKLSELSGFTVIDEIIIKDCSCTDEEKSEIEMLLKGGVFL